jgi:hypothetical protein
MIQEHNPGQFNTMSWDERNAYAHSKGMSLPTAEEVGKHLQGRHIAEVGKQ